MHHFGRHVIETTRSQLSSFAFACKNGITGNHVVRLVSDVRMSRLVVCVFGSTRRKQISGEFSPRSGIILSHFRSETFLKIGPAPVATVGSVVCARMLVSTRSATARRIGKRNFGVMM